MQTLEFQLFSGGQQSETPSFDQSLLNRKLSQVTVTTGLGQISQIMTENQGSN